MDFLIIFPFTNIFFIFYFTVKFNDSVPIKYFFIQLLSELILENSIYYIAVNGNSRKSIGNRRTLNWLLFLSFWTEKVDFKRTSFIIYSAIRHFADKKYTPYKIILTITITMLREACLLNIFSIWMYKSPVNHLENWQNYFRNKL